MPWVQLDSTKKKKAPYVATSKATDKLVGAESDMTKQVPNKGVDNTVTKPQTSDLRPQKYQNSVK